jgi:hypothetical protein
MELVSGTQVITDAIVLLRARMAELYEAAEQLGKQHFDYVMAENKNKTWEGKSVLFLKARTRDNTMTATWHEVRWYGSKALNTRRMVKKVIIKPKNQHSYTMTTLLKQAQPWEGDMVREIELELFVLRREAYFIGKALGHLNRIESDAKK